MTVRVFLPKTGMGIQEGTIIRWLKAVGDRVEQGESLVEVETVKATHEIEAPASGVLTETLVPEGETIEVGADIAIIEEA